MKNELNNQAYVSMMAESLRKKVRILEELYALTQQQESLLKSDGMDVDEFSDTTEKKGASIEELNQLDAGFDTLYRNLESEITGNRDAYADDIRQMKELISRITDLSTKIQVLEKKNYDQFQLYMKGEREKLKKANLSQQTAKTYAKNMAGAHKEGNSYFLNETK